ncbi:MAG: class I adenylate-forming enzyme family protein, partial [Pseudomonadota bacterium]
APSNLTWRPKGAELTHRSVINAVLSWAFLLEVIQRLRPDVTIKPDHPAILLSLPLFHVTGLHSIFLLSYLSGRKIVFNYRWDGKQAAKLIKQEKVTNFLGVPTMAYDLIVEAEPGDLDTLVDIGTGGAKRPEAQVALHYEKLPSVVASSGYGLTETNALGTHATLADYAKNPNSTGRAVPPVTDIATFTEDGQKLGVDDIGEICIKSPAVMRGYLDNPEATKKAFFPGGWFRTGDVGTVDKDGFVTISDRLKDLIIRGGENISSLEVENVLHGFDGVDEVAVFGVQHKRLGEIVGAAVYGREGLDLASLKAHAAEHLAGFKVPTRFWQSPTPLPRGTTGKTDKKLIRSYAQDNPAHFVDGDES